MFDIVYIKHFNFVSFIVVTMKMEGFPFPYFLISLEVRIQTPKQNVLLNIYYFDEYIYTYNYSSKIN